LVDLTNDLWRLDANDFRRIEALDVFSSDLGRMVDFDWYFYDPVHILCDVLRYFLDLFFDHWNLLNYLFYNGFFDDLQ
jgi:hypothetical protein